MAVLKIAIIVDSLDLPQNWQLKLIDDIQADDRFDLRLRIIHARADGLRLSSVFRAVSRLDTALFAKQARYETRRASRTRHDPVVLDLATMTPEAAALALARHDLDLVVRLSGNCLDDALLTTIAHGEWSLDFVDKNRRGADWAGFSEAATGAAFTHVVLVGRTGAQPLPLPLATARYNTKISAARNGAFVKEKAVILLMRELRRLADTGVAGAMPDEKPAVLSPQPGLAGTASYIARLGGGLVRHAIKRMRSRSGLTHVSWRLRMGQGAITDLEPQGSHDVGFPYRHNAADPFLFEHDGQVYLFYESYQSDKENAWIAVARVDENALVFLGIALRTDYHLSFPFVFSDGGEIYMIPETHQTNRVEVWRCTRFPLEWELYATALDGQAPADTVVFQNEGVWWLLTTLSDHHAFPEHCSELYAFRIDGPKLRSVVPHRRNPVVIGSDVARNAGRVHRIDGRLLRLSQCNAFGVYGYGLNIMEIEKIDIDTYRESRVRFIPPDFAQGIEGCHHLDAINGRFVLDTYAR